MVGIIVMQATICTKDKIHHFGQCKKGKMYLSTIGLIVQGCWYEIPRLNPQIRLEEFIVMPNHIHGVLILGNTDLGVEETLQCNVSTRGDIPIKTETGKFNYEFFSDISPKSGSISRILGSFKSACSKHIHLAFPDVEFDWQERFHDHIIRSEAAFVRISNYILNNPLTWDKDKFNNDDPP